MITPNIKGEMDLIGNVSAVKKRKRTIKELRNKLIAMLVGDYTVYLCDNLVTGRMDEGGMQQIRVMFLDSFGEVFKKSHLGGTTS